MIHNLNMLWVKFMSVVVDTNEHLLLSALSKFLMTCGVLQSDNIMDCKCIDADVCFKTDCLHTLYFP